MSNNREELLRENYTKQFEGREKTIQYLQTLLFWNRPAHIGAFFILVNVIIWYLSIILIRSSFFSIASFLGLLYFAVSVLVKKGYLSSFTNYLQPLDAPEGTKNPPASPLAPCKLYTHEEFIHLVIKIRLFYEEVINSLKILRNENHTKFVVQSSVVCIIGIIAGSIFSGYLLSLLIINSALLLPGLYLRGLLDKLSNALSPLVQKVLALIPKKEKRKSD
eukprot:TRINITY_DN4780_c0_g1_i1.p1 TRINITY_DN4780_c0_g1~~TRINITY_DN4780_c0_g1_i1.p1  ORF type:complete len:220 (+),score=46.23 TRINITY_DN4780_c0_g1_i1:45-704(+)